MSDPREPQAPGSANSPVTDLAARRPPTSKGRRRLIKLGASALPTALTLSSRPVHAWACNSTSAWGSAQINPSQSVQSRETASSRLDNTWTITQWAANSNGISTLGKPWPALNSKYTSTAKINTYLLDDLFSGVGGMPTGMNGKAAVYTVLNDKNTTTFQKYILTARLNARVVANVQQCLNSGTTDQLVAMATGSYSPPNLPTVVWDQTQIIKYLNANYIVLP